MPQNGYLAGQKADDAQIEEWVERFDRDGYLLVENVLPPEWCAELRDDLDRAMAAEGDKLRGAQINIGLVVRMFEQSRANLRLFDVEPIVTFAETLIGRDETRLGAEGVHVIHNNSFVTRPGGGITTWHQDDPAHFKVTHGDPPTNVRLPVLLFTANYYLTDVTTREQPWGWMGRLGARWCSHLSSAGTSSPRRSFDRNLRFRAIPC